VEVREKVSLSGPALSAALAELAGRWGQAEFAILSTCNRLEVYCARPVHGHPRQEELVGWLAQRAELAPPAGAGAIYVAADASAVRHLLAVACGLESMVIGEAQVAAQVKAALAQAAADGWAGSVLTELFQTALHVAKHVRTETPISEGNVSVAAAGVQLAQQTLGDLAGRSVLCVGAGKMSGLMIRRLRELGVAGVTVANRTPSRAAELVRAVDGQAAGLDELAGLLHTADLVLASTGSRQPILTADMVRRAMAQRPMRPMLIVDIAVPRDVAADVAGVAGVTLRDIDDLQRTVLTSVKSRHAALVAAEAIIARHVAQVVKSLSIRQVAPTIDALYKRMRRTADAELQAAVARFANHADADEDVKILRRALHRTIRRILHPAVEDLKRSAGSDSARAKIAALRELFRLDGPPEA
jgi:glutamyl-tRNA reductase